MTLKYVLVQYAHASITVNDTQALLNVKYRFKYFPHHFLRNGLGLCTRVWLSDTLAVLQLSAVACQSRDPRCLGFPFSEVAPRTSN